MREYRLKYEYLTKSKIEDDWDIHHIDFNRNNNNIKNLVALPRILHKEYHKIINRLNDAVYNGKKVPQKQLIKTNERLKELIIEIDKYISLRNEKI